MKKEFSLSSGKAMINFSAKYCDTIEKILESDSFRRVSETYLESIARRNTKNYKQLMSLYKEATIRDLTDKFVEVMKLLTIFRSEEIMKLRVDYTPLLQDGDWFVALIEDFYAYWRRMERYSVIQNRRNTEGLAQTSFIEANNKFTNLILELYRKVEKNVLGIEPNVYRQVPAGVNAGVILQETLWPIPKGYEILSDIPFISAIVMDSPFISYPKKNTRSGYFKESFVNPIEDCYLNKDHFFCYPAKIGKLVAFLYFHRDLMAHGISLSNLFEMAREEEYMGRKPDIVYVFGGRNTDESMGNVFYDDHKNGIMTGFVPYSDEIDYFGYMKKMSLTLHNLLMIKRGNLPIHGAMVNINMKNGKSANVVILGDSGAGKSESLEALRSLSEDHISDRSIFMNPDKTNARLVMPVATYKEIIKGYKVDLFLYANNYKVLEPGEPGIVFFKDQEEAKEVFRSGKRMAKGTTQENGLVESYFANPFGPYQKQEETDKLLDYYFDKLFSYNIKVGEIYTQLGVPGKEKSGPRDAAMELFKEITSL